ncbi:MAG: S49 family peptidase [Chitinophagales bacterium]|nr:S49 family peptidase [Hyphomicrobiales bacterium]
MNANQQKSSTGFFGFVKSVLPKGLWESGPVVPVIRLTGVIGAAAPLRPGLSLASCASAIERAFSTSNARAVAVQINSPGGSPVQSRLIFQRIRALSKEKSLPVHVFIEDVGASGGYLLALAGDEIYADQSSIVGSIGVIYAGFGFTELIEKIGVDRRVYTSGEKKMALDSFQPENPDDVARLKNLQAIIHRDFIDLVKDRRGKKIEAAGDQLFTGEFWTGRQALELGLIDGMIDCRTKMRELYGDKVRLKLVAMERGLFRRRSSGVGLNLDMPSGADLADGVLGSIEARALWARFGL